MKLGLKRKIVLVFIGMLIVVSALNSLLASYFTNQQNQDAAFATLKRDLLTWQGELQEMTVQLRTVALSAVGETVALNQLAELDALEYKLDSALSLDKGVKEAARTLAFSKSVSLNRLHLVLRSGGFSAIKVYINGQLSHQVSASEVGMFVQRGDGGRVWVKAAADDNGNLPLRNWPAWAEGQPPAADAEPPVERPQVAFAYPSADSMTIEVAVPVEGIVDESLLQGEGRPTELSVLDARIGGSDSDLASPGANQPPAPFMKFAVVVFQKRIDQAFLQAIERKTGMWPMLFSPDGRYHQQLGPLNLSLQQLLPHSMPDASEIKFQTIQTKQGSFYVATLPWQFEQQPGFVLALASSMDSTLHNIRQTVVAILLVTCLILLFSIGVGIFWVGRFIDPIIALTNAVKAIGLEGRLDRDKQADYRSTAENLRPLAISAPGEIGELAWAFDSMIGELHASFDTLEQRVQDRTAELHNLYQTLEEQNQQLEYQSAELSAANSSLLEEIGERKLIEDLLRLREQEFRSLAENSPDNIARYDREGRITYWNSRLHATLDLNDFISSREHIGKTTSELYPDGRFDDYEAAVKSVIESGLETEYEAVGPDIGAGTRHHLVRMVAERDRHGEVTGVLAMGRDITERKAFEKQLALLNYALDHVKDTVWLIGEDAHFCHVNKESCHTLGYGCDEMLSLSVSDIDPNYQQDHWPTHWRDLKANGSLTFESCHRTKDGRIFPVEINANYFEFDGQGYNLALARDITERKRIEETLSFIAQSGWKEGGESFLTALARYLGEMLEVDYVIVDKLADVEGHAESVALYAKGEVLANMQYDLKHTPCENVMEGELCCYAKHVQQLFPEDTLLVDMGVESYGGIPLRDSSGKVLGLIAVMDGKPIEDTAAVTAILQLVATRAAAELEREQSELALAESRQFLKQVIDTIPDPVFVKGRDHRWILLNREFCDFIGHPMDSLLGKSDYDFFPEHEADVFWAQDEAVFNSGKEDVSEEAFTDRDGVTHTILNKKICYTDDRGQQYLVGIILDITERKQYELNLLKRVQLEEQLSGLAASVPGFMFTIRLAADGHASFPFASAGIEQLVGLRPEDIRDDAAVLRARYHPDDLPRMMALMDETQRTLAPFRIEIRIFHPDNGMRWLEIRSTPQRHSDGSTEWHGLMIDITERKLIEEALKNSEIMLQEAQRIAHVGSWNWDVVMNRVEWSEMAYEIYTPDKRPADPSFDDFTSSLHPDDLELVLAAVQSAFEHDTPFDLDHRVVSASKGVRTVHAQGNVFRDASGKPIRMVGTVQDITGRKAMEDTLRKSGKILTEAQRIAHVGSWELNLADNILNWSDEIFRIFEIDREQFGASYEAFIETVHPDDREAVSRAYAESLERRTSYEIEHRLLMADGRVKYVLERCETSYDDNGIPLSSLGTVQDISERKQMEAELKSQADFQQTILNAVADAGMQVMMLEEGRILHVGNRKLAYEFGFTDEEIDSHPPLSVIVHPDDWERIQDYHIRRVAGEAVSSSYELGLVTHSGERREYETSVAIVPDTNPVRVITVAKDITERKRMETELKSQADFQQTLLNAIRDVGMQMLVIENGRMVYIGNRASAHTFGFIDEDIADQPSFIDFVHPDDRERVIGYHASRAKGETVPSSYELGLVNRNGERREYETSVAVVPGTDPVRTIAICKDITERKRMEHALASREQELRALAESSPGMVGSFYARPDGSVCMPYVSPNIRELFGLSPEEVADDAIPLMALNHPADARRVTESIAESARTMTAWHIEFRILHPTRGERWMEGNTNPQPHPDGGVIWYGFVHDITERKQAETEKQRLLNILEQSVDFVGFADMEGKPLYLNPAARRMIGLAENADFSAMHIADMHPSWAAKRVQQTAIPAALADGVWRGETALLRPDGLEIPVNQMVIVHRDADGKPEYMSAIMQDITERKQAETEKQRLLNILEQSVDFIGIADMQGNLLYHNRAALCMVGLPEDTDFSAMHIADMHPAWSTKLLQESAIPAALTDGVWRGETALLHRDGREIPVSQMVIAHRDADGKPEFMSTIMQDITERKQAEDEIRALNADLEQRVLERTEELRRQTNYLRTMIDTLPMMAWFKDTDSKYLIVNQDFAAAVGGTDDVEALVGKSDLDLWPREHAEGYRADDADVMATRRRKTVEETFIDANNDSVWIETFKAPVVDEDGSVLGTVGLARDISERKAVDAAREAALAEAERLARLRSEFMARMSHELRTPLNGILGYAQILQVDSSLSERQGVMLNVIQQSGEHLLSLINDILDFAKIEAGKQELSLGDIHLRGFLRNLAGIVSVRAEQKKLAFICDIAADAPEGIRADETRLRQVLLNLLSNAVKYSEQGRISLRVKVLKSGRLHFEIQDCGIGIDAGQLETIFQPFVQAGDKQHHNGGSGLGLVISRELVRLMGSDIHVASRIGVGSTFWFDLAVPFVDVGEEIILAEQHISGYQGPRRRVLVVDDVDLNRALLVNVLDRMGFETAEAKNGRECLDSVEVLLPDLVLLDMVMPEMDGMETARRLRAMPGFGQTPIIAVSADASGSDANEALKAGADLFLSKPIDIKNLTAQIAGLLKLDWIYVLPKADAQPQYRLDQWLEAPPMEEMNVLYRLAQEGSMRDIIQHAEHLVELDEAYRPFAEQLRSLAQGYQSKAILDFAERYINKL